MTIHLSGTDGDLPEGYIAIVVSRYNEAITSNLLTGALDTLRAAGFEDEHIVVLDVPGAWELPLPVLNMAMSDAILGVIALGAVIRGETSHDQHINRAVTNALMTAAVDADKPVALGLLTCNDEAQAIARSGGAMGNKGIEAAQSLLEMLRLAFKMQELLGGNAEEGEE